MIEIHTQNENNYLLISVKGDADASSAIHLDKVIRQAFDGPQNSIFIDCTKLNYISSAGLGVFMSYIEDITQNQINFVIYGLSEKVLNVFSILGLDQLLTIKKTKEEAISTLDGL